MSDAIGTPDDGTKTGSGLGSEGTIPDNPTGVGIGVGEPTTFEPEEDPEAAAGQDGRTPDGEDSLGAAGHP